VDESDERADLADSGTASSDLGLNFALCKDYIFYEAIFRFERQGGITATTCTVSELNLRLSQSVSLLFESGRLGGIAPVSIDFPGFCPPATCEKDCRP
jgi:hypothetical protein